MGSIVLPAPIASLIVSITGSGDLEAGLLKIIQEYLELKIKHIEEEIRKFEAKYGMSFEEFKEKVLSKEEAYSYEIEKDFWEWESLVTLKKYYEELRKSWATRAQMRS